MCTSYICGYFFCNPDMYGKRVPSRGRTRVWIFVSLKLSLVRHNSSRCSFSPPAISIDKYGIFDKILSVRKILKATKNETFSTCRIYRLRCCSRGKPSNKCSIARIHGPTVDHCRAAAGDTTRISTKVATTQPRAGNVISENDGSTSGGGKGGRNICRDEEAYRNIFVLTHS